MLGDGTHSYEPDTAEVEQLRAEVVTLRKKLAAARDFMRPKGAVRG